MLSLLRTRAAAAVRFASTSARPVPAPRGGISTPKDFLQAISKTRRNLADNSACVSAVGEDWNAMFGLTSTALKNAGVSVSDRKYVVLTQRYLLRAFVAYRQGREPREFAYDVKKKKIVRGCVHLLTQMGPARAKRHPCTWYAPSWRKVASLRTLMLSY